jgi:hypothetical protein
MPIFSEQWCLLVSFATDRRDVAAALDRGEERILAKTAHGEREPFQRIIIHALVRKGENAMFEPGCANVGNHLVIETGG